MYTFLTTKFFRSFDVEGIVVIHVMTLSDYLFLLHKFCLLTDLEVFPNYYYCILK